ncbi:MAG: ascorbate-dependent monooxygenase [Bryobacteraceae bacterium]
MHLKVGFSALAGFVFVSTAGAATPTFNKDVAPILYKNCVSCHRPGEVAPFSLLTYAEAKRWAGPMVAATERHYMPPWKAEPGFGEFRDARVLSNDEIATLKNWSKAGSPEGDLKDRPVPPTITSGWQLGKPDYEFKMPAKYSVAAEGNDIYECFVIPAALADTMNVAALEVRPGNRRVLHHTIVYSDATGAARKRAAEEHGNSYTCYGGPGIPRAGMVGGWAPGGTPRLLAEGSARIVAKGSDLIIQQHYHATGKPEEDQTSIGIYLAKGPITKSVSSIPLLQHDLAIPAGEKHYETKVAYTTPIDVEVTGVTPHMHLLGREMKVTATLPDGTVTPMIWIRDWDFNWQGQYVYRDPILFPKGTRFEVTAVYDNSTANPKNPSNPPKPVSWGEATTDEMCIAFIQYRTPRPADHMALVMALAQQLQLYKYRDLTGQEAPAKPAGPGQGPRR